jgi:hypothetical protein
MEAYKKLVETHEKTKKNGDAGNHNKGTPLLVARLGHPIAAAECSQWCAASPSEFPDLASADKLASSKQREKEVKESLRQESQRKKDAHAAERAERQALLKEERLTHDSKRAAKDRREVGSGQPLSSKNAEQGIFGHRRLFAACAGLILPPSCFPPTPPPSRAQAAKREQHAETGATCEHGVWRCRVCFPHGQSTDKAPRATPRVIAH